MIFFYWERKCLLTKNFQNQNAREWAEKTLKSVNKIIEKVCNKDVKCQKQDTIKPTKTNLYKKVPQQYYLEPPLLWANDSKEP